MRPDDAPPDVPEARTASHLFRGQPFHWLMLLVLGWLAHRVAAPALGDGAWLGLSDRAWFWLGIAVAAGQQIVGWAAWRAQLGWRVFTRAFGRRDLLVFGIAFAPFFLARGAVEIGLAVADRGSLGLPPGAAIPLGCALLVPAAYTAYSVFRYLGVDRVVGGDHFRERYRHLPLVRRGAFKWTPNAMYAFLFLALWAIALLANSRAALALAGFQHASVWIHYVCTERPDMELLYGERR